MSSIVQKAVQINTGSGATCTATFGRAVTPGNYIVVACSAIDHGGPSGNGATGAPAPSQASISDNGGNSYSSLTGTLGPFIWDYVFAGTGLKTIWLGQYVVENAKAATQISFAFTPITSAANCHVGIAVYELAGFGAWSLAQDNNQPAQSFNPLQMDLPMTLQNGGAGYAGRLYIECGAAILAPPSNTQGPMTGRAGWTFDGSVEAQIGSGNYSAIGFQNTPYTSSSPTSGDNGPFGSFVGANTVGSAGCAFVNYYGFTSALVSPELDSTNLYADLQAIRNGMGTRDQLLTDILAIRNQ